jgi:hypothetical protein
VALPPILLANLSTGSSDAFIQVCPLDNIPVLTVSLDSQNGMFYVASAPGATRNKVNVNVANHTRRLPETGSSLQKRSSTDSTTESISSLKLRRHVSLPTTQHNASSSYVTENPSNATYVSGDISNQVFYVRECGCFSQSRILSQRFCPVVFDSCGIPTDALYTDVPVACFASQTLHQEILRTAWPILLVWVALVAGVCCVTDVGMDARHYFLRVCCRQSNEAFVDRILQAPPGSSRLRRRRQGFLHSYLAEAGLNQPIPLRTIVPQPPTTVPTALELRTKRYKAPFGADQRENGDGDNEDDDGHEASCTICFHPLNDGDRIGDLECSHNFHVDCLKNWLTRRNTCPLCQAPNVATTRYAEPPPRNNDEDTDDEDDADVEQPVVLTQVSPFANPFSSGLIRQQVLMTVQARQDTGNATESRGRDSFRGVTILPQR